MLSLILKAAENFCIHQIRASHETQESIPKKRTLIAYLDIEAHSGGKYRTYIGCDEILLQCITEIFLGEETSDTETLQDMLLETTNMIVGSAKVLAGESSIHPFTISTPHYITDDASTIAFDACNTLCISGGEMLIAFKEL
ncbi:MAG TPA: chemotaxis protein CheX [Sulfuricurvum sp.]|nr:chemotaxis protein CheX [Sulfuricurvum sp.]